MTNRFACWLADQIVDIKSMPLSRSAGWPKLFTGVYKMAASICDLVIALPISFPSSVVKTFISFILIASVILFFEVVQHIAQTQPLINVVDRLGGVANEFRERHG
jgi:hypothetical protein